MSDSLPAGNDANAAPAKGGPAGRPAPPPARSAPYSRAWVVLVFFTGIVGVLLVHRHLRGRPGYDDLWHLVQWGSILPLIGLAINVGMLGMAGTAALMGAWESGGP